MLVVDGQVLDVGFGTANPLGPIPLGGEATYGPCTWSSERAMSPEGEDVWLVHLFDRPLYTFNDRPVHPVHYSATHPDSTFTQNTVAHLWDKSDVQYSLTGLDLTERRPDGTIDTVAIDRADYGAVLSTRFALDLTDDELAEITPLRAPD